MVTSINRKSGFITCQNFLSAITGVILFTGIISNGLAQAPLMDDLGYKGGSIKAIKKIPGAIHFVAVGDWGRNGENYQKEVAAGMGKAAHDLSADFIVATGDNFYPSGVQSTQDYHWISSFETIYTAQSLHEEWYPVLGNHDYGSNPDAQIAYSQISSRWKMPSRYYSKNFTLKDTNASVLMLFIDTDPIEKEMRGTPYDGVKYVQGAVAKQKQWIEEQLAQSKAHWKIVVGHHPIYTGGWRKGSKDVVNMKQFLEPIFEKYGVDLYLSGHEHHLEYTKPTTKTHHVISGAGSEARPSEKNTNGGVFAESTQGFVTFSINKNEIFMQFINYKDEIIFSDSIKQ